MEIGVKQTIRTPVPPAGRGYVAVPTDDLAPDKYTVTVRLLDESGQPIGEPAATNVTVEPRPAWTKRVRILNNLAMDLLLNERQMFVNPRNGWVFFAADAPTKLTLTPGDLTIALDGEAMHHLQAGEYTIRGNTNGLTVRAVPELVFAEFLDNPSVREFGPYDLDFMRRHDLLDSINTIEYDTNAMGPMHPFCTEWQAAGGRWISELRITDKPDSPVDHKFWLKPLLGKQHQSNGMLIDEFMKFVPERTEAARKMLADPRLGGKLFYPYVCSPMPSKGPDGANFVKLIAASGNPLVWERYLNEQKSEAEA